MAIVTPAEMAADAGPPSLVVRVKRAALAACMTCPLCSKLIVEATTISECLHTFCRKCIFEKLTDEEVDCCPICNIDLGCVPVEKLRPDHSLQDVRAKIFPLKRRKAEASDIAPSIILPVRRKERSLSSLVVNTPRVATQRSLTGRRTKAFARRASALRRLSPIITQHPKKEEDEDHAENSSSHDNLSKMIQNRRQLKNSSNLDGLNRIRNAENCGESFRDNAELWKPLNCLVEACNRTKSLKSSPQSPATKTEQINGSASGVYTNNSKVEGQLHKCKILDNENGSVPPGKVKVRRLSAAARRRRDLRISAQGLVDAAVAKHERRTCPIWLSLVASFNEQGDVLPQIDASYLKIKDGDLPVSFIQKYLVMKLKLANEAQVEIKCHCQTVNPMLALHNLVDLWFQQGSSQSAQASERVQATVGASAKDFVMVLTYNRKAPTS